MDAVGELDGKKEGNMNPFDQQYLMATDEMTLNLA